MSRRSRRRQRLPDQSGDFISSPAPAVFHPPAHRSPRAASTTYAAIAHTSGTTLSAQARYAAGTREILECWFGKRPIRDEYLIVDGGQLTGVGAHSYSAGNATKGSEEASRYKAA